MAISVDPATHIIYIPKADLTLVQASPEVRELDLNAFRFWLKDWEDGAEGMVQPKTHKHNTEATLSGLTYARIIEVLPPYTVEFEDGQYTVNCIGANHNVSDVKVANQVSLIVNNAAGLITNTAIEYSSFNGGVMIDVNSPYSGTLFPIGTVQAPVNNMDDALLIANYRGLNRLYLESSLDIDSNYDLSGFAIVGRNHVSIELTIDSLAAVENLRIEECSIHDSVLDGDISIWHCIVGDITYVNGHIHECGLHGVITLGGLKESVLANCYTVDQDSPPVVDMGGAGNDLAMPNYSGIVTIQNLNSDSEEIGVGLNAGMVVLTDTISAGTIIVAGNGLLIDNSTGTAVVNSDGLMNVPSVAQAVWEHTSAQAVLQQIQHVYDVEGGKWEITGNQMIFYKDDNTTEIARFNLYSAVGPSEENVIRRERV